MSGSIKCRVKTCQRTFYSEQAESAHYGKSHSGPQYDSDIYLLAKLNVELKELTQAIKLGEERAEVYQELADMTRESIRAKRLEATTLQQKITAIRLRFAEMGIPLEVKTA